MSRVKGFTLIELLIVVAIIAILAAIAVPNFLEAQVRAKVSRARNDIRTLRVGLESYRVDNNFYPNDSSDEAYSWAGLTTPVAFMTSIPQAAFQEKARNAQKWYLYWGGSHLTGSTQLNWDMQRELYAVTCVGPNLAWDCWVHVYLWNWNDTAKQGTYYESKDFFDSLYDPTNGTVSRGDIVATQKGMF